MISKKFDMIDGFEHNDAVDKTLVKNQTYSQKLFVRPKTTYRTTVLRFRYRCFDNKLKQVSSSDMFVQNSPRDRRDLSSAKRGGIQIQILIAFHSSGFFDGRKSFIPPTLRTAAAKRQEKKHDDDTHGTVPFLNAANEQCLLKTEAISEHYSFR